MASTTRVVLEKARFFLAQAEAAEPAAHASADRIPFLANIEAAVIYGRSVTFHLQKEFSNQSEFAGWYAEVRERLRANPRFRFLVETRNLILKEGPAPIYRTVQVTAHLPAMGQMTVNAVVIRGRPWYRRSPRISYEDARAKALGPVSRWKQQRDMLRRRQAAMRQQATPAPSVSDGFYFNEPAFATVPVREIVREYLDELETIVAGAETRFPPSGWPARALTPLVLVLLTSIST